MFQYFRNNIITSLIYFSVFFIFIYSYTTYEDPEVSEQRNLEECINTFSTKDESFGQDTDEIYIIGHAYGTQKSEDLGISNKLIKLFNGFNTKKNTIVLTGDFVVDNSLDELKKVKYLIEENFSNYLIAVGNHDVGYSGYQSDNLEENKNFESIFMKDLFIKDLGSFSLIAANFSTYNWEPNQSSKDMINSYIENTEDETIFLFSHQLFWLEETNNEIKPNSWSMLTEDLKADSLSWLKNNNKNIVVISGDFGANGEPPYCKNIDNKTFIASGISDKDDDKFLIIRFTNEKFYITIEGF